MASCPDCGSPIKPARTRQGERIPLETFTDTVGDKRYRVLEVVPRHDQDPVVLVEPVAPQSNGAAYPDHRKDCPAHGNGL